MSVILPTYNSEREILRSLQSVLGQSFSDLELIIVDDKSEGNTFEKLYAMQDARTKSYPARRECRRRRGQKYWKKMLVL